MKLSLPEDSPREKWFNATPIYVFFPMLIVIYAFSKFYFQHFNETLAEYLTPIVNGLGVVGIEIAPILQGPLDTTFYKNLSGISFIGAFTYNLVSILYMIKHGRTAALSCVDAHALLMRRKQWGARKTWIILHFYIYVGMSALGGLMTLGLLNSIFHWQVFSIGHGDILKTCLVSVYFCFLGMTPVYLYSVVLKYIAFDVSCIFKNANK